MAALAFQPGSVLQEILTESPVQPAAPTSPLTNPNQAQNGVAPQDTVILTGKGADAQLAGGNSQGSQPQETALFLAAQEVRLTLQSYQQNSLAHELQALATPPQPQTQTPGAPPQTAATNNVSALTTDNVFGVAQDQLAVLDRTLQRLGIDPQSISIFYRLTLLLYANNPAALRMLFDTAQGAAQVAGQPAPSNSAANPGNVVNGQAQASVQASPLSAGNGGGDLAQPNPSKPLETPQKNSAAEIANPPANGTAKDSARLQRRAFNATA